jgi:hypothetical protein
MKGFKKALVVLFVLAFIASVGATSASASGGTIGYLPMLPSQLSNAPIQVQARMQYHLMLPQLLEAKRQGKILDFQPNFNDGVLMVTYPSLRVMSAVAGKSAFSNMRDAMPKTNLATLAPRNRTGSTHVGNGTIRPNSASSDYSNIWFHNYDSCYNVYAADNTNTPINGAVVIVQLKNAAGSLLAIDTGTTDSQGGLYDCFDYPLAIRNGVTPGEQVSFSIYDPGDATTTYFGPVTVPTIQFASVVSKTGVLNIKSNADTVFGGSFWFMYPYWSHWNADYSYTDGSPTSFTHNSNWTQFIFNFGHPIYGGDYLEFAVADTHANFWFAESMWNNSIWCMVGTNYCESSGIPGKVDTITAKSGMSTGKLQGRFDLGYGGFGGELVDKNGQAVMIASGTAISATGAAPFIIPGPLSAAINSSTSFSGLMPINSYIGAYAYDDNTSTWSYFDRFGPTDSAGNYTADFSSDGSGIMFSHGGYVKLGTYWFNSLTGNAFTFEQLVSYP